MLNTPWTSDVKNTLLHMQICCINVPKGETLTPLLKKNSDHIWQNADTRIFFSTVLPESVNRTQLLKKKIQFCLIVLFILHFISPFNNSNVHIIIYILIRKQKSCSAVCVQTAHVILIILGLIERYCEFCLQNVFTV